MKGAARSAAASEVGRPPFGVGLPGNRWDLLEGRLPDPLPTVSVIVVHYEQQAELDRTLAALARQSYPAELLEIVVVDDGSAIAPTMSHGARLVSQADEGFRLSAARNLGAASSTGSVLCFLDADTAPEPGYVASLTRLPALTPETVAVGRRRHTSFDAIDSSAPIETVAPDAEIAEPRWLAEAYRDSQNLLESDNRSYRFVIGAVIACSRWFFDSVGGFDETFTQYGGEDWEWAHRAWLGGAVFAHVPAAVAWHNGPDWDGRSDDDSARQRRKNAETLQLARTIAVGGSAPRAVLGGQADVLVRLRATGSDAAAFVCVDSILAVLPRAAVELPAAMPVPEILRADPRVMSGGAPSGAASGAALDSPAGSCDMPARVRVDIQNTVRVQLDAPGKPGGHHRLIEAIESVGTGDLGSVVFTDAEGAELLTVTAVRAELRRSRWSDASLFATRTEHAPWLTALSEEPSAAAYLGGWLQP